MTNQLKLYMNLVPEYAYELLKSHIFSNRENTVDILITCPDKNVRYTIQQIIAYCINIVIQLNNLTL